MIELEGRYGLDSYDGASQKANETGSGYARDRASRALRMIKNKGGNSAVFSGCGGCPEPVSFSNTLSRAGVGLGGNVDLTGPDIDHKYGMKRYATAGLVDTECFAFPDLT